ncbi:MAG: metallophosphoesterase [Prevotella sp.]|nr:metallophosphoesterase [Prevotella sp.]
MNSHYDCARSSNRANRYFEFCLLLAFLLILPLGANAQTKKQLVILHTNDTHSTVYPLNPNLTDTMRAGRGGFLRRIAMLKQERQKYPNLLLIDSGDFSQGSSYYTLFKGDVEVELMNKMGYDAGTIGNHEFDYGLENMARLFRKLNFPIVCANYDFTGTPVEGTTKPYVILKRNGLRIGLFGLSPALKGLVATDKYGNTRFEEPIEAANRVVAQLQKKKCDIIICVSHLGWDESGGTNDQQLIAKTRGIDLVLGGHSHSFFKDLKYVKNLDGKEIPVDQNGKHAIYVGRMVLDFTKSK